MYRIRTGINPGKFTNQKIDTKMLEKIDISIGRIIPLFADILEDSRSLVSQELILLKKNFFLEIQLFQKKVVYGFGRALVGIILTVAGVILFFASAFDFVRENYPEIPTHSLLMFSGLTALGLAGVIHLVSEREK